MSTVRKRSCPLLMDPICFTDILQTNLHDQRWQVRDLLIAIANDLMPLYRSRLSRHFRDLLQKSLLEQNTKHFDYLSVSVICSCRGQNFLSLLIHIKSISYQRCQVLFCYQSLDCNASNWLQNMKNRLVGTALSQLWLRQPGYKGTTRTTISHDHD